MKKTTLVLVLVACGLMTNHAMATNNAGSGVFISNATSAGAFTSRGHTEFGSASIGGGFANSPTGEVSVGSVSSQAGLANGGPSNILTSVETGAVAVQNGHSTTASAGSNTITSSSVRNGTAETFAGADVSAVANSFRDHYVH